MNVAGVEIIPLGLDPRDTPFERPAQPSVLLFGRLRRYKGLQTLLNAMGIVWESRPDVRLIISGDGPEAAAVPDHPRIDFRPGYVPEQELDRLFAEASLVVLPYTQASQSGIGGLALARGIPVIVSDVGSLPDLAVDATFVVPAGSSEALARAVLAHIDHGVASRQETLDLARERFSWDAVASTSLSLYESVAA